jgi:geranylgeranylglycerol-phosphate geranylgeranyltransferase
MKKAAAFISLIRPINILITALVICTGYLISETETVSLFLLISVSLSGAFTAAAGNIVNDIFDIESDKINHPERPLARKDLTYQAARRWWFFFALLSFIISSFIDFYAFFIILGVHIILIFYSYKFKSSAFAGNFIIALLTALAFVYGAYAAGNFSRIIIPAAFAFLINYIRELVKDIQDIKGDSALGIQTFPGKFGIKNTKRIIIFFMLILLILTFYPFVADYYTIEFFIIMMLIVNPLLVYCIKILNSADENSIFKKVSLILKMNMAVGLFAIYIGQ